MVVAAFERLVAEEVDRLVLDAARNILFVLDVLQAISLVPAIWEDVKGDLAADGISMGLSADNMAFSLLQTTPTSNRDLETPS